VLIENQLKTYPFNEAQNIVCNNVNYEYGKTFYSPEEWKKQMSSIYTALGDNAFMSLSGIAFSLIIGIISVVFF
jgi:hypothetical protein